jgi:hypothetical protein
LRRGLRVTAETDGQRDHADQQQHRENTGADGQLRTIRQFPSPLLRTVVTDVATSEGSELSALALLGRTAAHRGPAEK